MITVLDHLNTALHHALAADERVIVLGEDILDPYGGAFKITRGLSSAFPDRVITTPISEAGIVGIATGMALRGFRPVVEIMFGDFLTLAADQIANHAAKFRWMYNDQVQVPLVIRTPMGGRRGYGPTHSQTLEKLFLGVPGLRVLAPCNLGNPGAMLESVILTTQDPVLFIENKLLYMLPVMEEEMMIEFESSHSPLGEGEVFTLTLRGAPAPTLTIVSYGYMADLARQAVLRLGYEREIFTELIIMTQLSPFDILPVQKSIERTGRLLAVEEGSLSMGWGAEMIARSAEAVGKGLHSAGRVAGCDLPVPASRILENAVLPGVEQIIQAAVKIG
jgi:acetoin:2,6-dichlorophenolindophenol oxidoreductase subunit beta